MAAFFSSLRTGDWLQRDRIVVYPLVILAIASAATVFVLMNNGWLMPNGSPFGTDFVSFWVAAHEALAGHPETPYLADRFGAAQHALFSDDNFYAFYYPPHYLAYMLPFGALPYFWALATWMLISFAAALWVLMRIAGRRIEVVLIAFAFPATFLTVVHGQNAFLSAALFGGGLVFLRSKPVLAGVMFGLLTFKPQLGLLIPLALLAGGYWRTILSAGVTAMLVAAFSALLFGTDIWRLFLAQGSDAMDALRLGKVEWAKMISTYAMLRIDGLSDAMAMTVQAVVSLTSAAAVLWTWRRGSGVDFESRAALLLTAALLATPFGLSYDLFVLAPALAFIAARGMKTAFAPYQKSLLAVIYLSPFAVLVLMADDIVIAPFILAILFVHLCTVALKAEPKHDDTAISAVR